jgi:putative acetyltransferase
MTPPSASPGVRLRPERPSDREAVRRVAGAAFGDDGPSITALLDALDAAGRVVAGLVAEVDGSVVGHVQLNRSWLDAREGLVDVLVLSPLSVAPDHQGRGLGAALVAAAIDAAAGTGAPALFLEGSPAYYAARGFRRADELGFERPSARIPPAAFQVVVLPAHEAWMTGRLVYCDAFWELDCVGLRDPLLARLETQLA